MNLESAWQIALYKVRPNQRHEKWARKETYPIHVRQATKRMFRVDKRLHPSWYKPIPDTSHVDIELQMRNMFTIPDQNRHAKYRESIRWSRGLVKRQTSFQYPIYLRHALRRMFFVDGRKTCKVIPHVPSPLVSTPKSWDEVKPTIYDMENQLKTWDKYWPAIPDTKTLRDVGMRWEHVCYHIINRQYPNVILTRYSMDGGADLYDHDSRTGFECKFTFRTQPLCKSRVNKSIKMMRKKGYDLVVLTNGRTIPRFWNGVQVWDWPKLEQILMDMI